MKPTMELRWHKHVHSMSWSTQWDENYTMTLQQRFIEVDDQDNVVKEEWRELPIHKTENPNMVMHG